MLSIVICTSICPTPLNTQAPRLSEEGVKIFMDVSLCAQEQREEEMKVRLNKASWTSPPFAACGNFVVNLGVEFTIFWDVQDRSTSFSAQNTNEDQGF